MPRLPVTSGTMPARGRVSALRRLPALALVGAVLLIACRSPFTPGGIAGTYTLINVNGDTLPYSETNQGVTVTVGAGTLVLNEAMTYTVVTAVSLTTGSETLADSPTRSGTFRLAEPAAITFETHDGVVTTGTFDGNNRVTVTGEGGFSYLYER